MSPVQNVLRQLVQRRLWPVAILLVAALAAVPTMLAKEPEPPAVAPPPVADAGNDELATQPIVSLADAESAAKRRKVLGDSKNPFRVEKPKKAKPADDAPQDQPKKSTSGSTPAPSDSAPADTGGGSSDPAPVPQPEQPQEAPKKPTYPANSLIVRFSVGDDAAKGVLERRSALPSADNPLLIYLGLEDDGKTAVFMLDSSLKAIGDGECDPSPESCEKLRLREGETMFFDVVDESGAVGAQFQLDLVKINAKRAKAARSAKVATVASGLGR
jgi:hypothetical protein